MDPASGSVYLGGTFTEAGGTRTWNLAVLEGGTFRTHAELLAQNGLYAELARLQFLH